MIRRLSRSFAASLAVACAVLPQLLAPSLLHAQTKPRVQVPAEQTVEARALVQQLLKEVYGVKLQLHSRAA